MKRKKVYWDKIRKKNKHLFESNPLCAEVISMICDSQNADKTDKGWRYMMKFLAYLLFALINPGKEYHSKEQGIFLADTDRANGWGTIWRIVSEMDKLNIPYYFELTKECYMNHKEEIEKLQNAQILCFGRWSLLLKMTCSIKDVQMIFYHYKLCRPVLKENKIGSMWEFLYLHTVNICLANGYIRFLPSCRFSVSQGSRRYGYLYNLYGIKHFALQHGITGNRKQIGAWSTLSAENVYYALTYGSYYARLYHKYFGTRSYAVGNVFFSGQNKEFQSDSKCIVFFSDCHAIVNKKKKTRQEMEVLNQTLDQMIQLYKALPAGYYLKIKLHPNENDKYWIKYSRLFGTKIEIVEGSVSSERVLQDVLLAVSWGNTVGLEAVKEGAVSVQLELNQECEKQKYSYIVHSYKEILALLNNKEMMEAEIKRQKESIQYYMKQTDRAEQDILKFILDECKLCIERTAGGE